MRSTSFSSDSRRRRTGNLSRRDLLKRGAALGAGLAAFSVAGSAAARSVGGSPKPPSSGAAIPFADLLSEAKKEGTLNTIALPRNWANYGQMIDTFKKKYGLKVVEAAPEISSAEENQAIKSLKGQKRAPDVLDVGPSFAIDGKKQGLYQPYKNRQWGTIPLFMKDAGGYWVGDYWGAIAFGANLDVVERGAEELAGPDEVGVQGQGCSQRRSTNRRCGLRRSVLGRTRQRRLARQHRAGDRLLREPEPDRQLRPGQRHDRNRRLRRDSGHDRLGLPADRLQQGAEDIKWTVTVPSSGPYGSYYCQAINKWAPHPFAARLWQEFIYSVQGQLIWLKGYSHPARFPDLSRKKLVPAALVAKLPPASSYDKIKFATPAQLEKAKATLTAEWGPKVLGS